MSKEEYGVDNAFFAYDIARSFTDTRWGVHDENCTVCINRMFVPRLPLPLCSSAEINFVPCTGSVKAILESSFAENDVDKHAGNLQVCAMHVCERCTFMREEAILRAVWFYFPLCFPDICALVEIMLYENEGNTNGSTVVCQCSTVQDIPVSARVGLRDRTVHPMFHRRMRRVLLAHRIGIQLHEFEDKEHWWWDSRDTNDGGVMFDAQVRHLFSTHGGKNRELPARYVHYFLQKVVVWAMMQALSPMFVLTPQVQYTVFHLPDQPSILRWPWRGPCTATNCAF